MKMVRKEVGGKREGRSDICKILYLKYVCICGFIMNARGVCVIRKLC